MQDISCISSFIELILLQPMIHCFTKSSFTENFITFRKFTINQDHFEHSNRGEIAWPEPNAWPPHCKSMLKSFILSILILMFAVIRVKYLWLSPMTAYISHRILQQISVSLSRLDKMDNWGWLYLYETLDLHRYIL